MLTRETISLMSLISLLVLLLASSVQANTEKTIFVAPASITIPNVHPGLDDLCIDDISPAQSVLRTRLPAAFPTKASPQGNQSWYILDQLRAGQRYEVRVCWVATQPTEFWLDTFPITHVFETPSLIAGLAEYAENRGESACQRNSPIDPSVAGTQTSALFLRLRSAADFYTTNKTLMSNPPLVGVDIILDPFVFNIFPRSLLPTAAYIIVIAIASWPLSGMIWTWLHSIGVDRKAHGD